MAKGFEISNAIIGRIQEIFTTKLGSMDQFGWFMDCSWCSSRAQRHVIVDVESIARIW